MIYKVTFKIDADEIGVLEDIFDEYNIDYRLEEIQESVVRQ